MKKLKKTFLVLTVGCAAACMAAGLAACDDDVEHVHAYGDWVITAPTQDSAGSAVKTCSADGCDKKTVTVTLPSLDSTAYTKTGDTATCTAGGEATFTYDKDGNSFTFTAATPAKGHGTLTKSEKTKSCTEDGFEAYWTCSDCHKKYSDENATTEISQAVVIPASHDAELWHEEAAEATCSHKGTAEYWLCRSCYQKFSDAEGKNPIDEPSSTPENPDAHLPLEHMEAVEATCTAQGTEEYWYCPGCLKKYSDADGTTEISAPVKTPIKHGTLEHVDGVAATCAAAGVAEYWYCPDCGQKFSDAAGTTKITNPATIPALAHTLEEKTGADFPASVTLPSGQAVPKSNNNYFECSVCHKLFTDDTGAKEITNPAKYSSRGGGVLITGNNLMCIPTTALNMYYKAETAGCHAFMLDGCSISKIGYIHEAADGQMGNNVYTTANSWDTSSKYADCFTKCASLTALGNMLYVDMNEGDIIFIVFGGITANKVFGVNVEKVDIADGDKLLFTGKNGISLEESQAYDGVEYKFIAPKDGFYEISVPADSVAYVMKDGEPCLSATEENTSYLFKASLGETIIFNMAADTNGSVTYPVTYTFTINDNVSYPQFVLGEYSAVTINAGYSSYEAIFLADTAGTYVFKMDVTRHVMTAGRNYYDIIVNGVNVGMLQATDPANKVWQIEITLNAGINYIKISNSAPQNQKVSDIPVGVFAAE